MSVRLTVQGILLSDQTFVLSLGRRSQFFQTRKSQRPLFAIKVITLVSPRTDIS